jgi:parvulin-like peptidyl-prolyl isomerase
MTPLVMLALLGALSDDAVVAHVSSSNITAGQVRARIANTVRAGTPAIPKDLVEDLINESVLAQEGYRRGLQRDPTLVARVTALTRRLAAEQLVEKELKGAVRVTDEELVALYHRTNDSATVQMVVVASEPEAQKLLARLRSGAKLEDEAKSSLDPATSSSGGNLGNRSRNQLAPGLADAVFAAPLGAFTGPVRLDVGWAVIRVTRRELAPETDLGAKKEAVRAFAEKQELARYREHYLMQLRKKANVQVDEAFIKGTSTRLKATPEELAHVIATVAQEPILYSAVLDELAALFQGSEAGHASGTSVKLELASGLVDQRLLEHAAVQRGLANDPQVRAAARDFERDEVVRLFASNLRKAAPSPTDGELEAWYQGHQDRFRPPPYRDCSHILVSRRDLVDQLRRRAMRGESFEALAKTYSEDPGTAPLGGSLGHVAEEHLSRMAHVEPALAAAFRAARPNLISDPVQSHAGWHLVRCGPQVVPSAPPLAEARPQLLALLTTERGTEEVKKEIATLRARATISVEAARVQELNAEPATRSHP